MCVQVHPCRRPPWLQRSMIQPRHQLLQHHAPGRESGLYGPAWPGTRLITAQGQRQTARWARECCLLEVAGSMTAPARLLQGQSLMLPQAASLPLSVEVDDESHL